MSSDIENLREQIRDIDTQILELCAKRMSVCRQVGEYKRKHKLPVKDYKVEKQILEKTKSKAEDLGIYPELAESMMKTLIKFSVIEQDEIKALERSKRSTDTTYKVLVVGGHGNMGRWMAQFFDSLGHDIQICDIAERPPQSEFKDCPDILEGSAWADIIILATPMSECQRYLELLSKEKVKAIVLELCSLKSPILNSIQKANESGLNLVSIHPMFGPSTDFLSGKNIIICDHQKSDKAAEQVSQIFKETSANVLHLPIAEHDKYMSYVLGSSHLLNLLYGNILESSGLDLDRLMNVSGTTFNDQVDVSKTVANENQDLYFDIQTQNHESMNLIEKFEVMLGELKRQIRENDRISFKKQMSKNSIYFTG